MSFTYDVTTDIGMVRLLIGDTVEPAKFTDEELQAFLTLEGGAVYLAAADCMDTLGSQAAFSAASSFTSVRIGDYSEGASVSDQIKSYQAQADRFRQLDAETPAFAIAEENFSLFSYETLLRNAYLRRIP
jgi:hypothetical protein